MESLYSSTSREKDVYDVSQSPKSSKRTKCGKGFSSLSVASGPQSKATSMAHRWLGFLSLGGSFHNEYKVVPPATIAELMQITPITMVFVGEISAVNGFINQLTTWGAPPCTSDS